jgi:hypothetical protein
MFTPSIILLMIVNTIAAGGAALVALQASMLQAREPRLDTDAGKEHFFRSSVWATSVGKSPSDESNRSHYGG